MVVTIASDLASVLYCRSVRTTLSVKLTAFHRLFNYVNIRLQIFPTAEETKMF